MPIIVFPSPSFLVSRGGEDHAVKDPTRSFTARDVETGELRPEDCRDEHMGVINFDADEIKNSKLVKKRQRW